MRMRSARQGLSDISYSLDGRFRRHTPGADAAAANACQRYSDERAGARAGQVVQPAAWFRLPDVRRGHTGHLRAHGNAAPLWNDGAAPRPICAGAVRARFQGHDGGGNPAGKRFVWIVVALIGRALHLTICKPGENGSLQARVWVSAILLWIKARA